MFNEQTKRKQVKKHNVFKKKGRENGKFLWKLKISFYFFQKIYYNEHTHAHTKMKSKQIKNKIRKKTKYNMK